MVTALKRFKAIKDHFYRRKIQSYYKAFIKHFYGQLLTCQYNKK